MKRFLSLVLSLVIVIGIITSVPVTAVAATFSDINQNSVFIKQLPNTSTCTLCAATNMMRRVSMLRGDSNWATITEASVRPSAWISGTGLRGTFSYSNSSNGIGNISVTCKTLPGNSSNTSTLINLLSSHPEGVVIYNGVHAVLLTDYTNGVFYCNDPDDLQPVGRVTASRAYSVRPENATKYWYVTSPSVGLGGSTPTPTPSYSYAAISDGSYYVRSNGQSTYNYLTVSQTSAASGAAVNAWSFMTVSRVQIANNGGNFYTMKFPDITTANAVNVHTSSTYPTSTTKITNYKYSGSTTQSWGFDKVSGGYVIRCKANPNMVLTCNGSGQATISAYSAGNTNQIWTLVPYVSGTVKYNANGGSGAPSSQKKYFNQALTLSSTKPTRSGYAFKGWGTSSSDTTPNYYAGSSYTSEKGITLYAIWETSKSYTIKYNANGGSGAPSSQTKQKGTTLKLSTKVPVRFGYTFCGWGTSADAASHYYPGDNFSKNANTTLYAIWNEPEQLSTTLARRQNSITFKFENAYKYYKITPKYDRDYHFESTGSLDTKIFIYNSSGTLLASDDNSGAVNNYKLDYSVSAGQTYYIKQMSKAAGTYDYSFTMKHKIMYNANGGSGAPSTQMKLHGKDITLSFTKPTRPGYTFVGWATSSKATSAEYSAGSAYTQNAGLKLYAVWKVNSYTVSFNANGGSCGTSSKSVTYNSTYGTLPTPTRSGYTFGGWYTSQTGGTRITSSTKYTTAGNTTLYARWAKNHTHSFTTIVTKNPTCTEFGIESHKCSCGYCIEVMTPSFGHKKSEWIVDKNATVYAAGSKHIECTVCKTIFETETIPQLKCEMPKVQAVNALNGIQVTWNAVAGAQKYVVYKRLGTSEKWEIIATTTTATSYTDTKANSAGTYYVYSVKTYNSANVPCEYNKNKNYTVQRVIAPKTNAINALDGISVTWSQVAGAKQYYVLRRLGTETTWTIVCKTTGTSYLDKNVTPGIFYLYSVRAVNDTGYSAYDINKRFTVQRVVAPKTNAKNVIAGINVTWSKVAGAKQYYILRRLGTETTWTIVCKTTGTSYLDKNVTPGIFYLYSVRAVNDTGYSAYDINKRYTVQRVVAPKTYAANTTTGINVTWSKVAGANQYYVLRRLSTESTWTIVCKTTGTSYLDKNVKSGLVYLYSVRAINNTGFSDYEINKRVELKRLATPSIYSAVSSRSGITLKWYQVTSAEGYVIYRKTGSGSLVRIATVTGGSVLSYIDKSAKRGTTYTYQIRAYSGNSYSAYSNAKTIKDIY